MLYMKKSTMFQFKVKNILNPTYQELYHKSPGVLMLEQDHHMDTMAYPIWHSHHYENDTSILLSFLDYVPANTPVPHTTPAPASLVNMRFIISSQLHSRNLYHKVCLLSYSKCSNPRAYIKQVITLWNIARPIFGVNSFWLSFFTVRRNCIQSTTSCMLYNDLIQELKSFFDAAELSSETLAFGSTF